MSFYFHKENLVFFDSHDDLFDRNQASTSPTVPIGDDGPILEMPQIYEQLFQRKLIEKVRKWKSLFNFFL